MTMVDEHEATFLTRKYKNIYGKQKTKEKTWKSND